MVETHRKYVGNENAYVNFGWKTSWKRTKYVTLIQKWNLEKQM